jgi:hypothetical protein
MAIKTDSNASKKANKSSKNLTLLVRELFKQNQFLVPIKQQTTASFKVPDAFDCGGTALVEKAFINRS